MRVVFVLVFLWTEVQTLPNSRNLSHPQLQNAEVLVRRMITFFFVGKPWVISAMIELLICDDRISSCHEDYSIIQSCCVSLQTEHMQRKGITIVAWVG